MRVIEGVDCPISQPFQFPTGGNSGVSIATPIPMKDLCGGLEFDTDL